jgi:hypothetical protein
MNAYEMFQTNDKLEQETGVVLNYGEFKIHIVRAGGSNKKFSKVLQTKMKPYRRQMDTDTLADGVAEKLLAEAYAESVILNWENVTDKDGKVLSFTKENVVKLLTDLPELFKDIQEQANKVSLFRAEEKEADAKN